MTNLAIAAIIGYIVGFHHRSILDSINRVILLLKSLHRQKEGERESGVVRGNQTIDDIVPVDLNDEDSGVIKPPSPRLVALQNAASQSRKNK